MLLRLVARRSWESMNTVLRLVKVLTSSIALLMMLACVQGCDVPEDDFAEALNGEWTTTTANGEVERVVFGEEEVTFGHGTDDAYSCPYRLSFFSSKTRTIGITLTCKGRTGTVLPVAYRMQFEESKAAFSLLLEGRNVGEYKTVASR
jgi:hypothetical protein